MQKAWLLVSAIIAAAGCSTRHPEKLITAEKLRADIAYLSDDHFQGRSCRSDEAREVAAYLADRFKAAGLLPIGSENTYEHAVKDPKMAPNVVGVRAGSGAGYVIISAHYDHLPPAKQGDDRIYNGADDNASGVAGMLAIADALHRAGTKTNASFIFVAFTGEEAGLRGSRFLAGAPPFDLAAVRGMFNMDMISRGEEDLIFVDGGKNADPLRAALRDANAAGKLNLRIKFDEHPDWLMRSDQGPFLYRKVPAVLLSVEDHQDYHQVTDQVERIIPGLAQRVARLVLLGAIHLGEVPAAGTTQPAANP